jgi:hypothetical protein
MFINQKTALWRFFGVILHAQASNKKAGSEDPASGKTFTSDLPVNGESRIQARTILTFPHYLKIYLRCPTDDRCQSHLGYTD